MWGGGELHLEPKIHSFQDTAFILHIYNKYQVVIVLICLKNSFRLLVAMVTAAILDF